MIDIQIAKKFVCVRCLLVLLLGSHPQRPTSLIGPVWQTQGSSVVPWISSFPFKVLSSLPTSFLKPIHFQYLLNVDLAGSFQVIAKLTRSVLKRTRRQPWRKMSLLCVSLQARLLWRGRAGWIKTRTGL